MIVLVKETTGMSDGELAQLEEELFVGEWADGRPKQWPTVQLRIRGKAFDVYCEHRTDVTLDGRGIPVVHGRTATKPELAQGWMVVL